MTVISSFNLRCEIVLYFSLVIFVIHQEKKMVIRTQEKKNPFSAFLFNQIQKTLWIKKIQLSYATLAKLSQTFFLISTP